MTIPGPAYYRSIVAMDIENSTASDDATNAYFRRVLYKLFKESLHASGIAEHHLDKLVDRGDGILALFHPVDQVPKSLLLNSFIPALSGLLAEHNTHFPDQQFRLRVVMHAGEVSYDDNGCFGAALNIAFRLLNAAEVKRKLHQSVAPLVLVVSDYIYWSVIWQRNDGIDKSAFVPLVYVRLAGQRRHQCWIHVPGTAQPPDLQDRISLV